MVEPAKDENKTQPTAQKTPDPKDGGKSQPTPAAGAKTAAPDRRGSGLIGKLFLSLILLLVVLGAAGYAALIFRDKDERVKVAADYIESELGQAQTLGNSQIFLTAINGASPVALAAANNGILGGWATVGGTDFAGYLAAGSLQGGVGALGTAGFPAYSGSLLMAAGGTEATQSLSDSTEGKCRMSGCVDGRPLSA